MEQKCIRDISSFALHILAMAFMMCDHLWATVIPGNQWLTWLGRLSFPVFAFLIVEGYFHTRNFKKYLKRMLIFALVSEIPFNLMYTGLWIFPFHQNVLWSFLLALLCMKAIDKLKARFALWLALPIAVVVAGVFVLIGQLAMVDYYGYGVLTVLLFYCLRGNSWLQRLGQLAGMVYINWHLISGMVVPVEMFGFSFEIPQQGMAVFALLPIWLYRGRQGKHNKWIQFLFYGFYPVHMLLLGLINMYL